MANLSKIQVADIIKKAPTGTSPEGIVAALRQQGHVLEGYALPEKVNTTNMARSIYTKDAGEKETTRKFLDQSTGKYVPLKDATAKQKLVGATEAFVDPAVKFIGSALSSPVDIARVSMGMNPNEQTFNLPSGKTTKTIQADAGQLAADVYDAKISPGAATLKSVGDTVEGAGSLLGIADAAALASSKARTVVPSTINNIAKSRELKAANTLLNDAIDITSPKVTTALEETALKQGRISEGGIFKKTKIAPTEQDKVVAESVQDIVSTKAKPQENINAVKERISQINSDVREFVRDNKVPFNEAQLRTKLKVVKDENKLVFASDPNVEKTVNAAIDEFVTHVKSLDTGGLFDARQSFDKLPAVKKLLQSEKLGENVKREVVLGIRRAANEYISDLLPVNNPYKALLKQETNMIRAYENIAEKATGRVGKSGIQVFLDQHPLLKKALPWLVGAPVATGVGAAISN